MKKRCLIAAALAAGCMALADTGTQTVQNVAAVNGNVNGAYLTNALQRVNVTNAYNGITNVFSVVTNLSTSAQ